MLLKDPRLDRDLQVRPISESSSALQPFYKPLTKEGSGTILNPKLLTSKYEQRLVKLFRAPGLSK